MLFDSFCYSLILQLLVVTTPNWEAVDGTLQRFERKTADDPWEKVGEPLPVVVGKKGMAWGRGPFLPQNGIQKQEGDRKAPAGLFPLGTAFGNDHYKSASRNMPFLIIDDDLEAVDDSASIYYNQFVRTSQIPIKDWNSSEKMNEVGFLYDLGIFVGHNTDPIDPACGSCIFLHIWRERGRGTAGCTALSAPDLVTVVSWLDEKKNPHLLQLPKPEWNKAGLPR